MSAKQLRLTSEQSWLVFHGLSRQMDQEEAMSALWFDTLVNRKFAWISPAHVTGALERMQQCYELQRKLQPSVFERSGRAGRSVA